MSVFAADRLIRQATTVATVTAGSSARPSERLLRFATDPEFAAGAALHNESTQVRESFTTVADAEDLAELLRRDGSYSRVTVSREGRRSVVTATQFHGPSTDDLARLAATGDRLAFWALYARVLPLIERRAREYGVLSTQDGPGAVFDEDDAHQRLVEVLLEMLADLSVESSFVGAYAAASREVFHEARRASKAYTLPANHDYALIASVVKTHRGDVEAAAADLESNPERSRHMSREKFFSLLAAVDSSRYVELSADGADTDDPTQAEALASIEDGFESEALDTVWSTSTDREREILTLRYGLDGEEPVSAEEVGQSLGLTKRRVNQIIKAIHARVAAGNLTDAREYAPAPKLAPVRKPRTKHAEEPAPVFPVTTRRVEDEVPTVSTIERRALPHEGITVPLRLRAGARWLSYRGPVPERVNPRVPRSNVLVVAEVGPDGFVRALREN